MNSWRLGCKFIHAEGSFCMRRGLPRVHQENARTKPDSTPAALMALRKSATTQGDVKQAAGFVCDSRFRGYDARDMAGDEAVGQGDPG